MTTLILQGPGLDDNKAGIFAARLGASLLSAAGSPPSDDYRLTVPHAVGRDELMMWRKDHDFDINTLPGNFSPDRIRLLVMDMDSTLISIECIDEIADFLGIKAQIAAITAAAMRGEINFETSLRQRIELLKGLDSDALEHVYNERLQLNPGAERMIDGLQRQGIKVALVSGGFTFFTDRLKTRLGLDFVLANELDFSEGRLVGLANETIVGAERKAAFLLELCERLSVSPQQTIAMGDGANDLKMMHEAGLSVAYHAKPAVQQRADTALNYCGLDGVLGLLGITAG